MNEHQLKAEAADMSRYEKHKFLIMVALTIVISLVMVGFALHIYATSGAEQLDLSRPGYQSVRQQVSKKDQFDRYPSAGPIDSESLNLFRNLYNEQAKRAMVDSFGGDVLSDAALGLEAPVAQP